VRKRKLLVTMDLGLGTAGVDMKQCALIVGTSVKVREARRKESIL
jgi:hypothetical protein